MTGTYSVFGYYDGDDDGERDQRRNGIPHWKLEQVAAWARRHRFDGVLIQLTDGPASSDGLTTHHVCQDPFCPGGCN